MKKINHAKKSDIVAVVAVLNKTQLEEIGADFLATLTGLKKKRCSNVLSHLYIEHQITRVRQGVYRLRQDPFNEEGYDDSVVSNDNGNPRYIIAKKRLAAIDGIFDEIQVNYTYKEKK